MKASGESCDHQRELLVRGPQLVRKQPLKRRAKHLPLEEQPRARWAPAKHEVAFDFSSPSPPSSPDVWELGKAKTVKEEAISPWITHYLWMDFRVFILSLDFLYFSLNQDGFDSQATEGLLSFKREQQALGTNQDFIQMQRKIYREVVRKTLK